MKAEAQKSIRFTVLGRPQTQGSIRAFVRNGRPILTSDNSNLKPWRQEVGQCALIARGAQEMAPRGVAMYLGVNFYLARPKTLPKRQKMPTKKPDLDKLVRALKDSLSGVLYADDSQVVQVNAAKSFGLPERAEIVVAVL